MSHFASSLIVFLWHFILIKSLKLSTDQPTIRNFSYMMEEETRAPHLLGNLITDLKLHEVMSSQELEKKTLSLFPYRQKGSEEYFEVKKINGFLQNLILKKKVDREKVCSTESSDDKAACVCIPSDQNCFFHINLAFRPYLGTSQFFMIRINITDINDNSPVFQPDKFQVAFSESDPLGTSKQIPHATDSDYGHNAIVTYRLSSHADMFRLSWDNQHKVLRLFLRKELDREESSTYKLYVTALDGGNNVRKGQLVVTVLVLDVNDCAPKFTNPLHNISVSEDLPVGSHIIALKATDQDDANNGKITYGFSPNLNADARERFALDTQTGLISLRSSLDREVTSGYELLVIAKDMGIPQRSATATIKIHVQDVNDCKPEILLQNHISVKENRPIGTVVTTFRVTDKDFGANGSVLCWPIEEYPNSNNEYEGAFSVHPLGQNHPNSYKLLTGMVFDREIITNLTTVVLCSDEGKPRLFNRKALNVEILDENDHSPVYKESFISKTVSENNQPNFYIASVTATDDDAKQYSTITYRITNTSSPGFSVDSRTGSIRIMKQFDREESQYHMVFIEAIDSGQPPRTATATLSVSVLDRNDVAPHWNSPTSFRVQENMRAESFVGIVSASDPDSGAGGEVELHLNHNDAFTLQPDGKIFTKKPLDRENKSEYLLTVYAKDKGDPRLTSSTKINITVEDVNDWAPEFAFPPVSPANLSVSYKELKGFLVAQLSARDKDIGHNAEVHYFLEPPSLFFRLDEASGKLYTAIQFTKEDIGELVLTCIARDSGSPGPFQSVVVLSIHIEDKPPKIQNQPVYTALEIDGFGITVLLGTVSGVLICIVLISVAAMFHRQIFSCRIIRSSYFSKANSYCSSVTDLHQLSGPPNNNTCIHSYKSPANLYSDSPSRMPMKCSYDGTYSPLELCDNTDTPNRASSTDSGKGTESNEQIHSLVYKFPDSQVCTSPLKNHSEFKSCPSSSNRRSVVAFHLTASSPQHAATLRSLTPSSDSKCGKPSLSYLSSVSQKSSLLSPNMESTPGTKIRFNCSADDNDHPDCQECNEMILNKTVDSPRDVWNSELKFHHRHNHAGNEDDPEEEEEEEEGVDEDHSQVIDLTDFSVTRTTIV